jgi:hypothetical protein
MPGHPTAAPSRGASLRLGREVAGALLFKLLALTLLFALCFSPSHRPDVDAGAMESQLLEDSDRARH